MARPQSVQAWTLAGAVIGFVLGWMVAGPVSSLVVAVIGAAAAFAYAQPRREGRPRLVLGIPTAVATAAIAALVVAFVDSDLAAGVVCGVGLASTVLTAQRARSWPHAGGLAVVNLFVLAVAAVVGFLIDVVAHGGFE